MKYEILLWIYTGITPILIAIIGYLIKSKLSDIQEAIKNFTKKFEDVTSTIAVYEEKFNSINRQFFNIEGHLNQHGIRINELEELLHDIDKEHSRNHPQK